ncbi:site-2 protease family protein [Indioceanicola profundi]|uniref:site-2 protease family protein n=1 Tax=Indioceanicola profundi TaxID=2220096 RepID=UPI000E6AD332|nr:site-2 protease family protein [Indioceanicola profundi]
MPDLGQFLYILSIVAIPAIVAITFHEAAHGYAALKLGDDTALRLGRVSFNPIRHVDPFGTVLLPLILALTTGFVFGWAKPVPVNFNRLNNPRRDMVWVALAGPGVNIALALASALLLHVAGLMPDYFAEWFVANLQFSVLINVILAVFNMIPLPPLDGGRVAVGILPYPLARPLAQLERYGMLILIGVIFLLPFVAGQLGYPFSPISWLLGPPVEYIQTLIFQVTGLLPW